LEEILNRARLGRVLLAAMAGAVIWSAAPPISAARFTARGAWQTQPESKDARVVIDEVGRRVAMPAEVKRIVTLAPNLTETVYALGLGDDLVGDTDFCDTPPAAKQKPHIGSPQKPSLEAIALLHPDLVLATTISRIDTVVALERLGIPVYTSDPHTVRETLKSMARMAELMGAKEQGAELVARLQQRLDALHARLEDRPMVHVLFVIWDAPLITIGQNTFIADALRYAEAESVVLSDHDWPELSLEEVIRLQPDYIVFAGEHTGGAATGISDLRSRPVWRDLDAVEMGHVVDVTEEALRPSPGLVDAIEQLARELHPEAFPDQGQTRKAESP
jgi:iron complex transport system substrate-binding protein